MPRSSPRQAAAETETEARRQIVRVCRRMYERGLIAGTDGNVSVRLDDERLLITPSGLHKGELAEEDLVVTDREGNLVFPQRRPRREDPNSSSGRGRRRPSSEILMHLLCYDLRQDVQAVVHAHPVHAVALAMAGVSLANCILPESCLSLGFILTAPYSTPGTDEVPRALRDLIARADAVLLDRHGSLTVGPTLEVAFNRLESVEHTARITHAARCLGEVRPLSERQVERLREVAARYGWATIPRGCGECNACPNGRAPARDDEASAQLEVALERYLRS
jgi:L-fuculose-phosphate aldolase